MLSRYRKLAVIGAGLALLVGLTAGPLDAASKTYTVSVNPTTLPYTGTSSQSSTFSFTFTNTTPSASINSVTLTAPTGYTITGLGTPAVTESSGNAGNYSATFNSTTITVTNLNPLSNGDSVTLFFSANIDTSNVTCQNNAGTWVPTAYNGSNLSGSVFSPTTTATTTIGMTLQPGTSTSYTDANGNKVTVTNPVGGTCTPLTLSRSANTTTIAKPTIAGVALKVDVVWDPEPAVSPLPWTQVDTPASANGPSGTHDIQWCGTDGQTPPGSEVSCLNSESSQLVAGTNTVQVHDVIYLLGDPIISR